MGPKAEARRLWLGILVGFALAAAAGVGFLLRIGDPVALLVVGVGGAAIVGALGTNLVLLRLTR